MFEKEIKKATELAKKSSRKRHAVVMHKDGERLQKLVNVIFRDSYIQPHRHEAWESFSLIDGKAKLIKYSSDGTVKSVIDLAAGELQYANSNEYHSLSVVSEKASIYIELSEFSTHDYPEWSSPEPTVLFTGAEGFVGHIMVDYFLENTDWNIIVLDRLNAAADPSRINNLESYQKNKHRVQRVWWDLRSELNDSILNKIINVDYVVHLAANSDVTDSIKNPVECFLDNSLGTVNLLEAARKLPRLKRFLYFSTDEGFGPAKEGENFIEGSRHNPGNPYASSKAGAEDSCTAWANTYGLPIVKTNTMNIYGTGQAMTKFIPMVVKAAKYGTKITIHGSKKNPSKRFWIYNRSVAENIHFILTQTTETLSIDDCTKGCFNIVGETEYDNETLIKIISKALGKDVEYDFMDYGHLRPGYDKRYALNGDKLQKKYGCKQSVSTEKMIGIVAKEIERTL